MQRGFPEHEGFLTLTVLLGSAVLLDWCFLSASILLMRAFPLLPDGVQSRNDTLMSALPPPEQDLATRPAPAQGASRGPSRVAPQPGW